MQIWQLARINPPEQLGLGPPWGPVVKTLPSKAGGASSFPVCAAKIPHSLWSTKQNIKQKQYGNKLNKDKKQSTSKKKKKEQLGLLYTVIFGLCKSLPNTDVGHRKTKNTPDLRDADLGFVLLTFEFQL